MEDRASRISELAEALGRPLDARAATELARYAELVAEWNRKIDLTAARDPEALAEVLFADALVLSDEALVPNGARVLDVGSGAGAPIVPLLVLRPDVGATLVEPLRKRVAFLRTAIGTLDLAARASVVEGRLDPAAPVAPGTSFDVALSRATFPPVEWVALGPTLARSTLVLVAKDPLPPPPAGASLLAERAYAIPSTTAPRKIGRYG